MGLDAILSTSMAAAKRLTRSLQVNVVHRPARTVRSDGTVASPGAIVTHRAIVETVHRRVSGRDGVERIATARVMFFEDVRLEDPDTLTLPDGSTPTVLKVERLIAPVGGGYFCVVWLGGA